MMSTFEEKKAIFNQRKNLRLFLNKNNLQVNEELLIFYPETASILKNIELQEKIKIGSTRVIEMIFFENYLDNFDDTEQLYFIFPSVSLGSNFYNTDLPVLKDEKTNLQKILKKIQLEEIDYLAISNLNFDKIITLEGYADYPCENNSFYDGIIYDYFEKLIK